MDRAIEDNLSKHMLKEEFLGHFDEEGVEYMVQFQMYEQLPGAAFEYAMCNPSEPWSKRLYPWHDFMRICLNQPLSSEVLEVTKYNILNLPRVLKVAEPLTSKDFNFALNAKRAMMTATLMTTPNEPSIDVDDDDTTDYIIHIVVGGKKDAGSRASLSINIIGQYLLIIY